MADVATLLTIPGTGGQDLTDRPLSNSLNRVLDESRTATLRSDLTNTVEAMNGVDDPSPFQDVVRTGFFEINVLAGLAGQHGSRRMPMIRCCDGDGIDGLIIQYPPEIGHGVGVREFLMGFGQPFFVRVTNTGDFRADLSKMSREQIASLAAEDTDSDTVIRTFYSSR